jgi:hypothetical protein
VACLSILHFGDEDYEFRTFHINSIIIGIYFLVHTTSECSALTIKFLKEVTITHN